MTLFIIFAWQVNRLEVLSTEKSDTLLNFIKIDKWPIANIYVY